MAFSIPAPGLNHSSLQFTVAIRAYNAATRLPQILWRLHQQVGVSRVRWEILIIDNRSGDGTSQLIHQWQREWTGAAELCYCWEERQGAVFARQRAVQEARGEWIGFLDDDNLPSQDWVLQALRFGRAHPRAVAIGSRIEGMFEVSPPPRFGRIAHFFPVIERDVEICFNHGIYGRKRVFPPGAGLVVRRQAWLEGVPEELRLRGPVARSLSAKGEDLEALGHLQRAGWEVWFNPLMRIQHWIPAYRLERQYLQAFFRGIGLGRYPTRMAGYAPSQHGWRSLFYAVNDLRKWLWYSLRYGYRLSWDRVAAAEGELLWATLWSPLYHSSWGQTWLAGLMERWMSLPELTAGSGANGGSPGGGCGLPGTLPETVTGMVSESVAEELLTDWSLEEVSR